MTLELKQPMEPNFYYIVRDSSLKWIDKGLKFVVISSIEKYENRDYK